MYSKGFVVAIVCNGEISKESKDGIAAIPFNAEYKIRLRNRNNRRAVAVVYVDDENVSEGGIVVNANSYVDLECPVNTLKNFKFVSSESGEAIDFGKNNKTDGSNGVIRVEWKLERERPPMVYPLVYAQPAYNPWRSPDVYGLRRLAGGEEYCKGDAAQAQNCSAPLGFTDAGFEKRLSATPRRSSLKEGCTVEGNQSGQRFTTVHLDLENGPGVIIQLVLRGYENVIRGIPPQAIQSTEKHCTNCGNKVGNKDKFCSKCGHRLGR